MLQEAGLWEVGWQWREELGRRKLWDLVWQPELVSDLGEHFLSELVQQLRLADADAAPEPKPLKVAQECLIRTHSAQGTSALTGGRASLDRRHRGELLGFPPTGDRVGWAGAALFKEHNGRLVELWVLGDLIGLREGLGESA